MFEFIDNWVEEKLKKLLHKRRQPIIEKATVTFRDRHPGADLAALVAEFNSEADRVYAIVDRSILRERIKRAKYTFWVTGVSSVILVALLGGFSTRAVLPFIAPPLTALVTWAVSLGTIPISYNQRIKGAMDSVLVKVEGRLQARPSTQLLLLPEDPAVESKKIRQDKQEQEQVIITINPEMNEEVKWQAQVPGIQFWRTAEEEKNAGLSLPQKPGSKEAEGNGEAIRVIFHM